jgi:hypothetical protein
MIDIGPKTVLVVFMKKSTSRSRLAWMAGAFAFLPLCVGLAADTNPAIIAQPAPTPAPVVSTTPTPAKLPYGVEDVLKLSRAQIGEEIILNYVHNSGTIYNLGPKDIVYLRDQGVSDKVINTMLDQRKRVELAAQSTAAQSPAAPNSPASADANAPAAAPAYADPNATYAEAPLTPPASSVYVIPYPAASYAYYGPYGYYYPSYYGGWYGPSVAFGFHFGGHGGFHGGHGSFASHGGGHGGGHHH